LVVRGVAANGLHTRLQQAPLAQVSLPLHDPYSGSSVASAAA